MSSQIVNRWISAVQLLGSIENDETSGDDKVGEFEKRVWVPGELKSGLGYQGTSVSLSLLLNSEELAYSARDK